MNHTTPTVSHVVAWREALRETRDPKLNSTAKLVAMMLSMYMNRNGMRAYPSLERLAADCVLAVSTVRRGLRALEASGWINKVGGGTGRLANEYAARIPEHARQNTGRSVSTMTKHDAHTEILSEHHDTPGVAPRSHKASQTTPHPESIEQERGAATTLTGSGSTKEKPFPPDWEDWRPDRLTEWIRTNRPDMIRSTP